MLPAQNQILGGSVKEEAATYSVKDMESAALLSRDLSLNFSQCVNHYIAQDPA